MIERSREQLIVLGLRVVDAFKEYWWIWGFLLLIATQWVNMQAAVISLQSKAQETDAKILTLTQSINSIQDSITGIQLDISKTFLPLQEDVENTRLSIQDIKDSIKELRSDVRESLAK